MTAPEPGRGRTPAERQVDVEAAPQPDAFAELIRRPARNSQELSGEQPNIGQPRPTIALDAAPVVVDVRSLGPRFEQGENFPGGAAP